MARKKKEFTITEAAYLLGISRQAVESAIRSGGLKARSKKVTEIVITEDSLESYRTSGALSVINRNRPK